MFKKYMIAILIISLVFSSFSVVYGIDDSNEDYVYIISPEVGESGKAIINNDLFISIYVRAENTLFLELIKTETPVFNFEEEEEEIVLFTSEAEAVEEKVSLGDEEFVEPKVLTKEEIYVQYQIASTDKGIIKESYDAALANLEKIPSVMYDSSTTGTSEYQLTEEDLQNQMHFEEIASLYNEALASFNYWENEYFKLFDTPIFSSVEMTVDDLFPYFEYSVDDISPGHYTLAVKNIDGKVIERLKFEVVSEQIIVDEIIDNIDFFDNIIGDDVFN